MDVLERIEQGRAKYAARVKSEQDEIDKLSPLVRRLVHQFGWPLVKAHLKCGVTNPAHILFLIKVNKLESHNVHFGDL